RTLIAQWTALRKFQALVTEVAAGMWAKVLAVAIAQGVLDAATEVDKADCSDKAMSDAFEAGYTYDEDREDRKGWSSASLLAQQHQCEMAKLQLSIEHARAAAAVDDAWAWAMGEAVLLVDAAGSLRSASADFAKALQDTNLAKTKAQLDAS